MPNKKTPKRRAGAPKLPPEKLMIYKPYGFLPAQVELIETAALAESVSQAEIVRRAVDLYFSRTVANA